MIDLRPDQLALVKNILHEHLPHLEVWVFGSRINGTAKPHSDLDLVAKTNKPLSLSKIGDVKAAFAESDLAIRVDLMDWSRISDDFKKIIQEKYEVVQESIL